MAAKSASTPLSKPFKQPSKPRMNKPDPGLEKLNARLQHISDTILQKSPYILTVPTDRPYRLNSYQESDWRRGSPFGPNEEQLQYMSFLARDDHDTVLRVIGGWDNENGEIEMEKPSPLQGKSGSSTPAAGGPKKKMSLAEYKKQKTAAKEAPKVTLSGSQPDKPLPVDQLPNGKLNHKSEESVKQLGHKRSHSDMVAEHPAPAADPRLERPEKKQRTLDTQETSQSSSKSTQSDADPFALPPMLSPTLSPDLEEEISKHRARSAAKHNNIQNGHVAGASSAASSQEPFSGKGHLAASSQDRVSKSPVLSVGASEKRPSLIVKFKISKARRNEFKKLLKTQPRAKKIEVKDEEKASQLAKVKAEAEQDDRHDFTKTHKDKEPLDRSNGHTRVSSTTTTLSDSSKIGNKRHRVSDETEALSKKRNKSDLLHMANETPLTNGVSRHPSTPVRDPKAPASTRLSHLDSDIRTPKGSITNSTPLAPPTSHGRTNRDRSESTISPSLHGPASKDPEVEAWANERRKMLALGKMLKHEADRLCNNSDANKEDEMLLKTAIATVIETILCYVLCFTVMDQEKKVSKMPVLLDSWQSTTRFIGWRSRFTSGYPLLNGLCLQMEAVCRGRLHAVYAENLDTLSNLFDDTTTSTAETPPAAVIAPAEQREKFTKVKDSMAENARLLQSRWTEAVGKLTIDDMMKSFPETWAQRAKIPVGRQGERLKAGVYAGDFYLPLGMHSKEIEAVRAGWAMLNEWCRAEKVQWKGKLPF